VITVLCAAGSFVLLAGQLSSWFTFLVIIFLLWFAFLWLPSSRSSSFGRQLAIWFAPSLAWLLNYAHPIFEKLNHIMHDRSASYDHTGLYDKTDLVDLLQWQKDQTDNHIPLIELNMAQSILSFGDTPISDILVPRSVVHSVNAQDNISPVLIDELHKSGFSFFPVYDSKKDNIVGTLFIGDLIDLDQAKSNQQIKNIMQPVAYYVHEDFNVLKVFHAFLKTHHHLFIVVNKFEEFVGVVTIGNIVSDILGESISDEFDNFEDLHAVAAAKAKKEHAEHQASTSDTQEMIE
jgi:CBS domain containing-hemolysin-like protein